jgi:hypothetical protein
VSSETKTQTTTQERLRFLGLACMIGGLLWWLLNVSGPLGLPLDNPMMQGLIGMVLLVGLMGGPLGLLALHAAGGGRTGRVGKVGGAVVLLGLLSYLAGQTLQTVFSLATSEIGIFYAVGALLIGLGMLPLGIAAVVARRLPGWRRFAPLSVGAYYVAMIPIQLVLFIVPNGAPSNTLLAFWGFTWALLGYAILSEAGEYRATRPAGIRG